MAYSNPQWNNGGVPAINKTNLNALSDAVAGMQCPPQVSAVTARTALGLGTSDPYVCPIANGGTGASTAAQARQNLGITPANIGAVALSPSSSSSTQIVNSNFKIDGNLEVTGTTTIQVHGSAESAAKLTTARSLQVKLSESGAQSFDGSANATSIGVYGILPTSRGGTGTGSPNTTLSNILSSGTIILTSANYGNNLPIFGNTTGQIFFKRA